MNPFDLRGPEFLLFYAGFTACVLTILWWRRRLRESGPPPQIDLSDPYLVAFLRGGSKEAVRVATTSLIDRGLLQISGKFVYAKASLDPAIVKHPIERGLMLWFKSSQEAKSALGAPQLQNVSEEYQHKLAGLGLMPDESLKGLRRNDALLAAIVLGVVAAIKVMLAITRMRSNFQFLIILAVIAVYAAYAVASPPRTLRGDAVLKDLKTLFGDLRQRKKTIMPGGATKEVVWLAAVFGLAALPAENFPFARKLFPASASSDSSFGASSCGSSCGGGGCGGGCGGCGS